MNSDRTGARILSFAMDKIILLFIMTCQIHFVTGYQGLLYRYQQTVTINSSANNAAEILTKPLTECAVTCLASGGLYIAEHRGTRECACVGAGESLPQGTWKLFYGKFRIYNPIPVTIYNF